MGAQVCNLDCSGKDDVDNTSNAQEYNRSRTEHRYDEFNDSKGHSSGCDHLRTAGTAPAGVNAIVPKVERDEHSGTGYTSCDAEDELAKWTELDVPDQHDRIFTLGLNGISVKPSPCNTLKSKDDGQEATLSTEEATIQLPLLPGLLEHSDSESSNSDIVGRWFHIRWTGGYIDVVQQGPKDIVLVAGGKEEPLSLSTEGWWANDSLRLRRAGLKDSLTQKEIVIQRLQPDGKWGINVRMPSTAAAASRRWLTQNVLSVFVADRQR
jgi:hypothetical protein